MLPDVRNLVCAVCNRAVDRITYEESYHLRILRFHIECHGQVETTELTLKQVLEGGILLGQAFATERAVITPPPRALFDESRLSGLVDDVDSGDQRVESTDQPAHPGSENQLIEP